MRKHPSPQHTKHSVQVLFSSLTFNNYFHNIVLYDKDLRYWVQSFYSKILLVFSLSGLLVSAFWSTGIFTVVFVVTFIVKFPWKHACLWSLCSQSKYETYSLCSPKLSLKCIHGYKYSETSNDPFLQLCNSMN